MKKIVAKQMKSPKMENDHDEDDVKPASKIMQAIGKSINNPMKKKAKPFAKKTKPLVEDDSDKE